MRMRIATLAGISLLLLAGRVDAEPFPAPVRTSGAWSFSVREDVGRILSARGAGILTIGSAATAVALAVEDSEAQADALEGLGGIGDLGNVGGSPVFVLGGAVTLALVGRFADRPAITTAGVDLARSLAYSSTVVAGLKVAVDRTRPDGGRYSFPSAHAAAAFSAAPVLTHHFGKWVGTTAYALAGAAAVGRMRDRKHYLSDVCFGATIGFVAGDAVAGSRRQAVAHLLVEPGRLGLRARF